MKKLCKGCGVFIPRPPHETSWRYKNRNIYCSAGCHAEFMHGRSRVEWEPIQRDPSIDTTRCWAGFKAGARCVHERGHSACQPHRDDRGREWSVGLAPRVEET